MKTRDPKIHQLFAASWNSLSAQDKIARLLTTHGSLNLPTGAAGRLSSRYQKQLTKELNSGRLLKLHMDEADSRQELAQFYAPGLRRKYY